MARANRYIREGSYYHVTHRCHDRRFLLKFVKDRNGYRSLLRAHLADSDLSLLAYCITSNHVHLLFAVPHKEALSDLMQAVQGEFAQQYNRRKRRSGAFWGDRFHATLVGGEAYLLRCLRYIDMNMVRAGVVDHPEQWDWCGYREFFDMRRRYRLIDRERLFAALEATDHPEQLLETYRQSVEEAIVQRHFAREAMWTESLAVGSEAFVRAVEKTIRNRRRIKTIDARANPEAGGGIRYDALDQGAPETWVLREEAPPTPYSAFSGPKNASKAS